MNWGRIKIDKADKVFSNYIREKAGWKCEKCGKLCRVNGELIAPMDASHYYGRRKESVRFDEENVHALCKGCHMRMGGYKKAEDGEYDIWMKELLGQKGYDLLMLRANTTGNKDREMAYIIYTAKLRDLKMESDLII